MNNITKYLQNGTMTIQVSATLHGYNDPIETLDVISDVSIYLYHQIIYGTKYMTCIKTKSLLMWPGIVCEGTKFKVHRVILASQSAVFKKMFEVDMKEKQCSIVNIPDISPMVMSDVIDYLYTEQHPT